MIDINTITPGHNPRRAVTILNDTGKLDCKIDLVAEYLDGVPMIAIKYDKDALVTSLAFLCGINGS